MKKIVPIIIAIIFMFSVVIIGYFGMAYRNLDFVDVQDFTFRNVDNPRDPLNFIPSQNRYNLRIQQEINSLGEPVANYLLQIDVTPANATNAKLEFTIVYTDYLEEPKETYRIERQKAIDLGVNNDRILVFLLSGQYTVTVKTNDGTGKYKTIYVTILPPEEAED